MDPFVAQMTYVMAVLTVLANIAFVVIVLGVVFHKRGDWAVPRFLARYAVRFSFLLSVVAVLGSVFYSEVAGFPACSLCFWQRVVMYPLPVLLGIATVWYNRRLLDCVLALSFVGMVLAAYNQYLQFGGVPLVPCGIAPGAVSCSQRFFLEFGYVTIPMMSLTIFALIAVIVLGGRIHKSRV